MRSICVSCAPFLTLPTRNVLVLIFTYINLIFHEGSRPKINSEIKRNALFGDLTTSSANYYSFVWRLRVQYTTFLCNCFVNLYIRNIVGKTHGYYYIELNQGMS